MVPDIVTILALIKAYGPWASLIVPLAIIVYLIRILLDEDRSAAWRARIYKGIFKISGQSKAEKKYIENDVCSRINLARRNMPFAKDYLPKSIGIQWFDAGTGKTWQVNENEIIVRLDPAESEEKNIALIADALVKRTSLAGIRHVISEPLELSMDLNLVKDLLKEIGDRRVLDWYFRNEYGPTVDSSDEIKEWNGKIVEIDEKGLFTRLLLVELDNYSKKIIGKPPSEDITKEIVGLIDFLYKIATKVYRRDVPLDYITRNIRIGIILVGSTSKILYDGIDRYLKAFAFTMERQLESIYVILFDKELLGTSDRTAYEQFVRLTEGLDDDIKQRFKIEKDFDIKFTCTDSLGNKRKAKITHYTPEYV